MSYIDAAIACIVAREFLEATMFITSHFNAVRKSSSLDASTKTEYYKALSISGVGGLLSGLAVSLGVGFGLKAAFEEGNGLQAEIGMEAGEAVSKLIGGIFVTKMLFKIPKWFGISNYGRVDGEEYERPNTLVVSSKNELEAKDVMSFNLYWNIFREMAEAGCFVAIEGFVNPKAFNTLGYSVLVGLAASVGTFAIMGISMNYGNNVGVGITCAIIVQMLATGLLTGSAHAFEEVAELSGAEHSPYVWKDTDSTHKNVVRVFGFFGISSKFTVVQFLVWSLSIIIFTTAQVWHNVYGYPLNCCSTGVKDSEKDSEAELTDYKENLRV